MTCRFWRNIFKVSFDVEINFSHPIFIHPLNYSNPIGFYQITHQMKCFFLKFLVILAIPPVFSSTKSVQVLSKLDFNNWRHSYLSVKKYILALFSKIVPSDRSSNRSLSCPDTLAYVLPLFQEVEYVFSTSLNIFPT